MNYDITFIRQHEEEVFRIYNALSLMDAVQRFQKANPEATVVAAKLVKA